MTLTTLLTDLRAALPAAALVTAAGDLPAYGHDFWTQRGVPGAVVRATSTEQVAATLRFAARHGVPVVPRAGRTSVPDSCRPPSGSCSICGR